MLNIFLRHAAMGKAKRAASFRIAFIRSSIPWLLIGTSIHTRITEENAMLSHRTTKVLIAVTLAVCALGLGAQMLPNPYGPPIGVENAKKAAAAALAEAVKNHWNMAVAVVEPNGTLVYYEKMDNTQIGSANVSIEKARTAAQFKRATKAFQEALAKGGDNLRILGLPGVTPFEGGVPIIADGKSIGAIGLSGANSDHGGHCALVAAATIM